MGLDFGWTDEPPPKPPSDPMTLEEAQRIVRAGHEVVTWLRFAHDVYTGFLAAASPVLIEGGALLRLGPVELKGELIHQGATAAEHHAWLLGATWDRRVRLEFTPIHAAPPEPPTARVVFHFVDGDERSLYEALLTESPDGLCEPAGAGENANIRLILGGNVKIYDNHTQKPGSERP